MQLLSAIIPLALLVLSIHADDYSRKLTTVYNPNCPPGMESGRHVAYTRAVSSSNPADVLLMVFSAGRDLGPPSLLMLRASGHASALAFNWTAMTAPEAREKRGGIVLKGGEAVFKAAYLLQTVWEFNDTTDAGNMSAVANGSHWRSWDADRFVWTAGDAAGIEKNHAMELTANSTTADDDEEEWAVDGNSTDSSLFHSGSKLQLRVVHHGLASRADTLPRLQFTGNSSQLDVVMNHLRPAFKGSRFAISMMHLVSLPRHAGHMTVDMSKSVDDEFTPGIFKMFDWKAAPVKVDRSNTHHRSFVQWKPVCYTSPDRHLKMSQQMFSYPLPKSVDARDLHALERSAVFALFGGHTTPLFDAVPMNISFGQSADGFYKAYNFTSWTASMGLGQPPHDQVTALVILIIAIGLGLPVLLMFVGGVYICVRRRRSPIVSYEQIQ